MDIKEIVKKNCDSIVEAIAEFLIKHSLNPYICELRLYVKDSGTISLKSEFGCTQKIWNGRYYVICSTGGNNITAWDIIGNVFDCLGYDDMLDILDDISDEKITKSVAEKYIEEEHPELIESWLKEFEENHYDDIEANAENIYDEFLMSLSDIDFDDIDD